MLWERPGTHNFAANPSAIEHLLVAHQDANPGAAYLVPIKNPHEPEANLWPVGESVVGPVTFSPDGRLAAAGTWYAPSDDTTVIRAWDLETSQETVLQLREPDDSDELGAYERGVIALAFTPDGNLMSSGYGGVRLWDLETADSRWIVRTPEDKVTAMAPSDDCRHIVTVEKPSLTSSEGTNLRFHNLETGSSFQITTHGDITYRIALDRTGEVFASTGSDGVIKIGPTSGSEPHLLFGHEGSVRDLAFSSDGRWLGFRRSRPNRPPLAHARLLETAAPHPAAGGADRQAQDADQPPGRPRPRVLHRLEARGRDPFPGWETVPTW